MVDDNISSHDRWQEGEAYEPYMGRWSRLVAREFLAWLDLPAGGRWLDAGCGTGALTETILETASPAQVKGVDRSEGFIAYARQRNPSERVDFAVGDVKDLPVDTEAYDAVVSGLVLNLIPDPARAAEQMRRAVRPGGTVAVYVWDYAGKMQFLRHFWNMVVRLDPPASDLDEGRRFPLCQPAALKKLFSAAGLSSIEVKDIQIDTDFKDFDDYWAPFLGGQGPAPGYVQSLGEERRHLLRERIRMGLPIALDGSIPLVARAWAIRGIK